VEGASISVRAVGKYLGEGDMLVSLGGSVCVKL